MQTVTFEGIVDVSTIQLDSGYPLPFLVSIAGISLRVHSVVGPHMASLQDVLQNAGVQDTFIDKFSEDGWTIELFAMAAPNLERFDEELKDMLGELFDITTAVQRSAIRLAWTRCQSAQSTASAPAMPSNPVQNDAGPAHASWSETFPPKLTAQVVSEMKQRFKKNYPTEIFTAGDDPEYSFAEFGAPSEIQIRIPMGPMEVSIELGQSRRVKLL